MFFPFSLEKSFYHTHVLTRSVFDLETKTHLNTANTFQHDSIATLVNMQIISSIRASAPADKVNPIVLKAPL